MNQKESKRIKKIPKESKRFKKIQKNLKELISKQYFTLKEPARAQKANGSSLCLLKNQRLRGVAWAPKNKAKGLLP